MKKKKGSGKIVRKEGFLCVGKVELDIINHVLCGETFVGKFGDYLEESWVEKLAEMDKRIIAVPAYKFYIIQVLLVFLDYSHDHKMENVRLNKMKKIVKDSGFNFSRTTMLKNAGGSVFKLSKHTMDYSLQFAYNLSKDINKWLVNNKVFKGKILIENGILSLRVHTLLGFKMRLHLAQKWHYIKDKKNFNKDNVGYLQFVDMWGETDGGYKAEAVYNQALSRFKKIALKKEEDALSLSGSDIGVKEGQIGSVVKRNGGGEIREGNLEIEETRIIGEKAYMDFFGEQLKKGKSYCKVKISIKVEALEQLNKIPNNKKSK